MLKHNKGGIFFKIHGCKRLLCFQVYDYYKVVINVLENTNKIFILCEQYYLCIITFPHMTNRWLHIKNWQLIYVSRHFSIITNCYLPCVFYTQKFLMH